MIVVSVDIGSTWTKGASFEVDFKADSEADDNAAQDVRILRRAARATTVGNLADGFLAVLADLVDGDALAQVRSRQIRLYYSSSAKGGLAVAAIGLVPEVTLEIGKVAAQSAGARLTQVFSYRLTRQDVARLEAAPPDILLFAGGTDGGNSAYILDNAAAIGASRVDCEILYAGNRSVADDVAERLAGKRLTLVDNLLPTFDEPNPEPARAAMRKLFLDTIVRGKGLDRIVDATGEAPVPTPFAVLEYARAIRQHVAGWEDFMLFDLGGATTDVYSAHREAPAAGTVLRGLSEPEIKRSVEGDLGLRVSAQATCGAGDAVLMAALEQSEVGLTALERYAGTLAAQPDYLPTSTSDRQLDTLLAGVCVAHAAARHAGRCSPVYTPEGEVQVQVGRDLRRVTKVIGSGGWLARAGDFTPALWLAAQRVDQRGRAILLPARFDYYRDASNVFPLLANLARACPAAAARAGISQLMAA